MFSFLPFFVIFNSLRFECILYSARFHRGHLAYSSKVCVFHVCFTFAQFNVKFLLLHLRGLRCSSFNGERRRQRATYLRNISNNAVSFKSTYLHIYLFYLVFYYYMNFKYSHIWHRCDHISATPNGPISQSGWMMAAKQSAVRTEKVLQFRVRFCLFLEAFGYAWALLVGWQSLHRISGCRMRKPMCRNVCVCAPGMYNIIIIIYSIYFLFNLSVNLLKRTRDRALVHDANENENLFRSFVSLTTHTHTVARTHEMGTALNEIE